MKFYENVTFEPELSSAIRNVDEWEKDKIRLTAWIEEVGCAVLAHVHEDVLLTAQKLVLTLDECGRLDLIPDFGMNDSLNDPLTLRRLGKSIATRLSTVFGIDKQVQTGIITAIQIDEEVARRGTHNRQYRWYHFMPDVNRFDFAKRKFTKPRFVTK